MRLLDTCKVESGKITFLKQHQSRTLEALQFLGKKTEAAEVSSLYAFSESQLSNIDRAILRLSIDPETIMNSNFEIRDYVEEAAPVLLSSAFRKFKPAAVDCFKWEDRSRWAELKKNNLKAGSNDVLLIDENENLIETDRFNIFFCDHTNKIYKTPPLSSGCVNGVLRRYLLENQNLNHRLVEHAVSRRDLSNGELFVGNSVRGVLPARII